MRLASHGPRAIPAGRSLYQFSLRRLLFGFLVVAIVLAIAVSFPVFVARVITVNLLLIAPSVIVFAVALPGSSNRKLTLAFLIAGTAIGYALSPRLFVSWSERPTFWELFLIDFETNGLCMFGGVIIGAYLDAIVGMSTKRPGK